MTHLSKLEEFVVHSQSPEVCIVSNVVQKKQQQEGGGWCGLNNSKKVLGSNLVLGPAFSFSVWSIFSPYLWGLLQLPPRLHVVR